MDSILLRLGAVVVGAFLLTSAYHRIETISVMTEAANRFLASLTPEQRAQVTFPFGDAERVNWHFIPKERKGLPLMDMQPHQKQLATALLSAGLSQQGFMKAVTIMSLDDVLRVMEKDNGQRRNPEKYYFSIFGTPSDHGTWGYRVEGHHLSQNYTVHNGHVVDAPSFFGSNPAEVKQGPRAGLRTLFQEDDMGFAMIGTLDAEQKKVAVVDQTAYKDIITFNNRTAALSGQPSGLLMSKMNASQVDALMALMEVYARNVPDQMAEARAEMIKQAGRNIYFAWAGGINKGDPHYYRVQAASFLIEFDMTQDNANHIHSVWRDAKNDFGDDVLKAHYQDSHR